MEKEGTIAGNTGDEGGLTAKVRVGHLYMC